MKKLFYLFTILFAGLFAACDNGQPEGPSGDSNVPENPSNPDKPSNPDQPSDPSKPEDPANGHAYVDLGLSVKWATCNVGANAPEEFGDYFAWGETQPKAVYSTQNYKWFKNGNYKNIIKYCTDSEFGTVDNKTVLDLEDDAAYVNWGGAWRMPTYEEQLELIDNCTWTWTSKNGINGYFVTSKANGNSIFLPAAYARGDNYGDNYQDFGYYLSSSLVSNYPSTSYLLWMCNDEVDNDYDGDRNCGFSVRPVLP